MNPYSRESLLTYTVRRGGPRSAADWRRFLRWEKRRLDEAARASTDKPGCGDDHANDGAPGTVPAGATTGSDPDRPDLPAEENEGAA